MNGFFMVLVMWFAFHSGHKLPVGRYCKPAVDTCQINTGVK